MIPISRASTKSLIAAPPNSSSARSVRTTVRLVMIDRPKVCRIEWLTMSANGSPACRALFSRIRSKTTIVSCTEKPMTVSIAVTNSASICDVEERAEDREDADDDDHVVEQRDERGDAELDVAEPVGDPEHDPDRADDDQLDRHEDEVAS